MVYLKNLKTQKGQSLVEAALTAPLIVFFLFSLVWFANIMLTWQQIISASRFGIDLITYTDQSEDLIKKQVFSYLCDENNVGRILDKNKLEVITKINDADEINYTITGSNIMSGVFNPKRFINNITDITPFLAEKSSVEIKYKHKMPYILRKLGIKDITIKHKAEVLSGTGRINWKRNK